MLLFSDLLYMLVRHASPIGPMCLRCLRLTLSGPMELFWTCFVVSIILIVCSLCFYLYRCMFVLCVFCLTVLLDYLLNAFAICVGEMNVFSLLKLLGCFWVVRVFVG